MKVSEWLRQYQSDHQIPIVENDEMISFWSGWLIGRSMQNRDVDIADKKEIETAIKVAEFIEEHAR